MYLAKIQNAKTRDLVFEVARNSDYEKVVVAYRKAAAKMKPGEIACMYRIKNDAEVLLRTIAMGRTYGETRAMVNHALSSIPLVA